LTQEETAAEEGTEENEGVDACLCKGAIHLPFLARDYVLDELLDALDVSVVRLPGDFRYIWMPSEATSDRAPASCVPADDVLLVTLLTSPAAK
jgi:hypothetical protein